jgi:acyl transferase domain-containing protein
MSAQARRLWRQIEDAAEAAYDRFYEIGSDTSDLGYTFQPERTKREWREVAMAVLEAVAGGSHE